MRSTYDIDSYSVYLTVMKVIKDLSMLSEADEATFKTFKHEDIDFLLKSSVKPIPLYKVPAGVESQTPKWVQSCSAQCVYSHVSS